MKQYKKLMSLIALALGGLFAFSACETPPPNDAPNEPQPETPLPGETETENYILKNGASDYKIVIPQKAKGNEVTAANELQAIFLEATGVRLPITSDDDTSVSVSDKLFSVGRTKYFADTGITVDKQQVRADGFKLWTVDDDVYFCGGEDTGTLYSVYEFLYRTLNFETFYADCYTLDKNVRNMKLMDYEVTERPDIAYRAGSFKYTDENSVVRNRMRVSGGKFSYFTSVDSQPCHNSLNWLPVSKHYSAHKDWYASDKEQLCYTARGNETSLNAMLDACLEKFKEVYATDPQMKAISLSIQDVDTFCTCGTCLSEKKKYGTDAAVIIKFCNKLSKKMEAYVCDLNKDDPNFVYDIDLVFFAYKSATAAPVDYNASTKTYTAKDSSVICGPHVAPWYAPVYMDYTRSIKHSSNAEYYQSMYGWDALSETMYLWTYDTNFMSYMIPYDSVQGYADLFELMADVNAEFLLNQSQWNNARGCTAWHLLKAYLTSKLSWDHTESVEELTKRFFDAMYGPASETMMKWYQSSRAYTATLQLKGKYQGTFSTHANTWESSDYWSYPILRLWMDYAEEALAGIERLKESDPVNYALYYEHIVMERVSPYYLMLQFYETNMDKVDARYVYDSIVADTSLCLITRTKQGGYVDAWAEDKVLQD